MKNLASLNNYSSGLAEWHCWKSDVVFEWNILNLVGKTFVVSVGRLGL